MKNNYFIYDIPIIKRIIKINSKMKTKYKLINSYSYF